MKKAQWASKGVNFDNTADETVVQGIRHNATVPAYAVIVRKATNDGKLSMFAISSTKPTPNTNKKGVLTGTYRWAGYSVSNRDTAVLKALTGRTTDAFLDGGMDIGAPIVREKAFDFQNLTADDVKAIKDSFYNEDATGTKIPLDLENLTAIPVTFKATEWRISLGGFGINRVNPEEDATQEQARIAALTNAEINLPKLVKVTTDGKLIVDEEVKNELTEGGVIEGLAISDQKVSGVYHFNGNSRTFTVTPGIKHASFAF